MFTTADSLLQFLQLERERPSLDYLNRIVREHQLRVPFETFTKLLDYEPGLDRGDFMPPIDEYVERIVTRGAGGLCWTLARGLQWLLTDLGFDAALMHMQPGHCCVRVELAEGPFYADVGYGAPIFQAYPLFESFSLDTHREKFEYNVTEQGILVTRNPGPTKTLDPTPLALDDLRDAIVAANQWHAMSFLTRLTYAGYIDGVYTSINNGTLRRHIPGAPVVQNVDDAEILRLLRDEFGADPELYTEAAAIHAKWMEQAGLAARVKASCGSRRVPSCFRELLGRRARALFLCSPRVTTLLLTLPAEAERRMEGAWQPRRPEHRLSRGSG